MRLCIFCGQRAETLEDAWPRWLFRLLGPPIRAEVWFGPDGERKEWSGAPIRVRCVCAACNNGWMSQLEGRIRPLIGSMMHDLSIRLDRTEQHLIAAWCMKTAMVFEWTNPGTPRFYSKTEREHLRLDLSIPDDTLLWLGRQYRSNFTYCHGRRLFGPIPKDEPVLGEGYVTTFAASRLVLQVITVRRYPEHQRRLVTLRAKPGPWDRGLLRVWPASPSIRWPSAWSFGEPDLEPFSERFRNPA